MGTATKAFIVSMLAAIMVAFFTSVGIPLEEQQVEEVVRENLPGLHTETSAKAEQQGRVVQVIDGDTIIIATETGRETIRLIGIDAPETAYANNGDADCYASEATAAVTSFLDNQAVTLATDPTQDTRDTYDRLLAYVTVDSVDLGEWLLREGYVREYTFRGVQYQKQAMYKAAERAAQNTKRGLWSACR